MPIMRDANGNPVIVSMDQMLQRIFDINNDGIRVIVGGMIPEVHNIQPAAAGAQDITFSQAVSEVTITASVDTYVTFDGGGTASATNGQLIPAKTPVTIRAGAKVLHTYATAAGTITATGLR